MKQQRTHNLTAKETLALARRSTIRELEEMNWAACGETSSPIGYLLSLLIIIPLVILSIINIHLLLTFQISIYLIAAATIAAIVVLNNYYAKNPTIVVLSQYYIVIQQYPPFYKSILLTEIQKVEVKSYEGGYLRFITIIHNNGTTNLPEISDTMEHALLQIVTVNNTLFHRTNNN